MPTSLFYNKPGSCQYPTGVRQHLNKRGLPKQEMAADTLRLWDVDGGREAKQIGSFSVILKYADATIELPVRDDDLALPAGRQRSHELIPVGK